MRSQKAHHADSRRCQGSWLMARSRRLSSMSHHDHINQVEVTAHSSRQVLTSCLSFMSFMSCHKSHSYHASISNCHFASLQVYSQVRAMPGPVGPYVGCERILNLTARAGLAPVPPSESTAMASGHRASFICLMPRVPWLYSHRIAILAAARAASGAQSPTRIHGKRVHCRNSAGIPTPPTRILHPCLTFQLQNPIDTK